MIARARKLPFALALIATSILGYVSLVSHAWPAESTQKPKSSVTSESARFLFQTTYLPTAAYAPYYAAKAIYWPELNLEGNAEPGRSGTVALQAVAAGKAQMGNGAWVDIMKAIQDGAPIKAIANIQEWDPTALLWLERTGIRGLKDFEGKTVGGQQATVGAQVLKQRMKDSGVDLDRVTLVNTEPGAEYALIPRGTLAGVTGWADAQPVLWACQEGLRTNVMLLTPKLYNHAIFVNTKWREKVGHDVVARALTGIARGFTLVKTDFEKAVEVLQKTNPQSNITRAYVIPFAYLIHSWSQVGPGAQAHGFGWIDQERVRQTQDFFFNFGRLDKKLDVSAYYTDEFLKNEGVREAATQYWRAPLAKFPADLEQKCGPYLSELAPKLASQVR